MNQGKELNFHEGADGLLRFKSHICVPYNEKLR